MKRVGKVMSVIGLILRKTIYKILLAIVGLFGLFWVLPPNAVTIIGLLLIIPIIILPFEWKGRHAMYTMKRFAFSCRDLKVIFGLTTFFVIHFTVMLMKAAYLLRMGIEYGFAALGISAGVTMKIREARLLFGSFPSIAVERVICVNAFFIVVAVIIAEVINREEKR